MKLAILKVILWPNDSTLGPRIVNFEPNKINVLTGESGTGKSAITWIIDYCLGSDKCTIPKGLIRDLTSWFGLHIKLANTELVVARRNPQEQQSTTDMYWAEAISVAIPPVVRKNARIEDLKNRLNQIGHLPSLDFSTDDNVGFGGRPSSRDMAAFNFQPQHIVANPHTLFYKADTTEHREKLRIIFPLVLGAIDSLTLARQRELKDTEREYDRLKRELDARLSAARAWEAEIESFYLQAQSLGLAPSEQQQNWSLDRFLLELKKIPELVKRMDLPDIREGTNDAASRQLSVVIAEEDRLASELGSVRRRLDKLDQLSSSVREYDRTLANQADRLEGSGWFREQFQNNFQCPVCTAVHEKPSPHLEELSALASEFSALAASVQQAPAKLDQELADLRQELRDRETALTKVRQTRRALEAGSNAQAAQRQRVRQIYLFVGRIEQALENVSKSRIVDDLQARVNALSAKIAQLKNDLDPKMQAARLNAAIDSVSARVAEYARLLQLEHSDENVRLNIKELTLQFTPLSGRTDFLWEVGSGQNWVGYHVACLLALHEHFIRLGNSAVPRFLVVDQPSQVYFPEAWPTLEDGPPENPKKTSISSDIEGVRRIFTAVSHFFDSVANEFQVIVTEHAGSITWKDIPHIHFVANWRQGEDDFLIPKSWQLGQSPL
jgi:uncharacterized protein YceH (UPF0502 family)